MGCERMCRLVHQVAQAPIGERDTVRDDERLMVGSTLFKQCKKGRGRHHFQSRTARVATLVAVPREKSIARLNLTGEALTPGAQRSWWLREALAAEPGSNCPPLARDVN